MANVTMIEKALKEYTGAVVITKKQLADAMNKKSVNSVTKYVEGLPKFGCAYFIRDVAEQILRYGEY